MNNKISNKGSLIVVSGPSGVGKGTICGKLIEKYDNVKVSVSATSRSPRVGETDGVSYFFKTRDEFVSMINSGELIEYNEYNGNFYGTPKAYVEEQLKLGYDVILEIDVNGAMNVKKVYPEAVLVFIAPPTMETIRERLIGRGTENIETIEQRIEIAKKEILIAPQYDYIVINNDLDMAIKDVVMLIDAARLRVCNNKEFIENLLK